MTLLTHEWLDQFHRLGAEPPREFGLPPAAKLAQLIRPAIVARPGKVFVWCDWSAIEARVLPWLAASRGSEAVLDIFRTSDADPSLPDIYKINAGKLLGKAPQEVTDDERQSHGKVPVLSLGFGGGLGALQNMANNYRVYLDDVTGKAMVDGWRDENKWARQFWGAHNSKESYGLWGAICSAVENRDTIYEAGRVAYVYDRDYLGGTMFCALPSGHMLSYPAIKWEKREVKDKKTGELVERWQLTFRRAYTRKALWYGLAAENITQATAAMLLRRTLVALRAEEDWMPVVGHTHDEVVTEVDEAEEASAKSVLMEYFTDGFEWTKGLPLAAEASSNWYYTKAKV